MKNKQTKQRSRRLWLLLLALVIPALLLWYHHYQTNKAEHTHGDDCGCEQHANGHNTRTPEQHRQLTQMEYQYGTNYRYIGIEHIERWDVAAQSFTNELLQACPHRADLKDTVVSLFLEYQQQRLDVINSELDSDVQYAHIKQCVQQLYKQVAALISPGDQQQWYSLIERNNELERKTRALWTQKLD